MQRRGNTHTAPVPFGWTYSQVRNQARRIAARIVEFIDARADAHAAAALYAELSRLSEAELERRSIPRGELHRCVFETLTKR
jgi:hypothetical protein